MSALLYVFEESYDVASKVDAVKTDNYGWTFVLREYCGGDLVWTSYIVMENDRMDH